MTHSRLRLNTGTCYCKSLLVPVTVQRQGQGGGGWSWLRWEGNGDDPWQGDVSGGSVWLKSLCTASPADCSFQFQWLWSCESLLSWPTSILVFCWWFCVDFVLRSLLRCFVFVFVLSVFLFVCLFLLLFFCLFLLLFCVFWGRGGKRERERVHVCVHSCVSVFASSFASLPIIRQPKCTISLLRTPEHNKSDCFSDINAEALTLPDAKEPAVSLRETNALADPAVSIHW